MDKIYTTQELLALRKLTRALGEVINEEMQGHLRTLTPLFRQRNVFGEHVEGPGKELVKDADPAFAELQALYDRVATAAPFHLPRVLKSPLMQMTPSLELTPWEYVHVVKRNGESKSIAVTCPYKSILTYAAYSPRRLREVLANPHRNEGELLQFVLHYLAMHVLVSRRPGLSNIMEVLHFPIGSGLLPGLGHLPITYVASSLSTGLPPDSQLLESTELSGKDAFEELVNVGELENLRDPLKDRLSERAKLLDAE